MNPHPKHRRGFATIVAIAMIGLVGAGLAGLAVRFSSGARRTARELSETQQRQFQYAATVQPGFSPTPTINQK